MPSNTESFINKYWIGVATIAIVVILFGGFKWIANNPYAVTMDEAVYINQAHKDINAFSERGVRGLGREIVFGDRAKPPLYRTIVLPVTAIWDGFSTALLRSISLIFLVISAAFIFLAARQISGPSAGALAAILLVLSPVVLEASKNFNTEYPLIFSIVTMFYFLFRALDQEEESWVNWIGLGVALGLGALSKMTFIAIAGPVILLALFFSYRNLITGPGARSIIKSIALGSIIALPWWILNIRQALEYAIFASGATSSRHALSDSLLDKLMGVPVLYMQIVIGPALAILIMGILITWLIGQFSKSPISLTKKQKIALWLCLAGVLPLLYVHITGNNQNMRYAIVPLIPFILGISILAERTNWTRKSILIVISSLLIGTQMVQIVKSLSLDQSEASVREMKRGYFGSGPAEVMTDIEYAQWSWESLRVLANEHGVINEPRIYQLGGGHAFNTARLAFPWVKRGEKIFARKLWRYESGEIDWDTVREKIADANIVITAPGFIGHRLDKQHIDNQHNETFSEMLSELPSFSGPFVIIQGTKNPVKFHVFLKRENS